MFVLLTWESIWKCGLSSTLEDWRATWEDCKDGESDVSGYECANIFESGVYDWFEIKTGVKLGCCIYGFLFLVVVYWVMRKTTRHWNIGIRWKSNSFLEDLDFADNLALISSSRRHIQTKVNNLGWYVKMMCLKINTAKTMIMSWNLTRRKVQIDGEELEMV